MLMEIFIWMMVGAFAGLLADLVIMGIRLSLLGKVLIGILGGLVGGYLWMKFVDLGLGFAGRIIAAFFGAIVFLLILRIFRGKKDSSM